MVTNDLLTLPYRIQQIYDSCQPNEQQYLIKILEELSSLGYSPSYDTLWLQDFKEIPVDIMTFICDERYLGETNSNGDAVYPYWKDCMSEIFEDFTKYQEVVFTGATRIGKTSTAITCAAYMLYWMMCLRDPQSFFGKKEISKFSLHFFNITKELASGVAYRELNDVLKNSQWFNAHGTFSKSERNFYYIPEGGKIVINYGSDYSHALGQQVFCLTGDTIIKTDYGNLSLRELENTYFRVYQYNKDTGEVVLSELTTCIKTKYVTEITEVILEDGTIIEGTPDHKVMLVDGTYKMLQDLTKSDYILNSDKASKKIISSRYIACEQEVPVYDIINAVPHHNFILNNGVVAHNCAVMDEVNFARSGVKDISKAKAHMKELYDVVVARIEGTFRLRGKVYGKMFSVSSKKTDSDFLEDHIQTQLQAGNEHLYVADKPQWEVLPSTMFSPEKFYIAVGDRYKKGQVVENDSPEALEELKELGYTLMQVPIDMKTNFLADFDVSLRDIAGISVPGALSFITQDTITACLGHRQNPFTMEILEIGTKDTYFIEDFFHIENIEPSYLRYPHFIHLDLSSSDDKTGIGDVCICGRKDIEDESGKTVSMPTYAQIFSIAIKAPRGDKIPYAKITQFIVWLRRNGFNIQGISKDTFQSEYMGQLLTAQGFDVRNLSLDRTPDGYMALRSIMMEERIDLLDIELYQNELIHLERDGLSGKIDHPVGGCLCESTSIAIADMDGFATIRWLLDNGYEGHTVWTYNEETNQIEPKPIKKIFKAKTTTDIVELTVRRYFEDGSCSDTKIKCTSDHKFLTYGGHFIEAERLHDSCLMSFNSSKVNSDLPFIIIDDKLCYVENIEYLNSEYDVFDLEIEDNHNFYLEAGCFVHNSKDTSDALAGSVWCATLENPGIPVKRTNVARAAAAVANSRTYGSNSKDQLNRLFPQNNIKK